MQTVKFTNVKYIYDEEFTTDLRYISTACTV